MYISSEGDFSEIVFGVTMYILKKFVNALSLLNSYPENGIPLPETNRSGTSYYTNKLYKNFIVVLEAGL